MRHFDPNDSFDLQCKDSLNPDPWMVELLAYNPDYCSWGNYEDCMSERDRRWNSPLEYESWDEMFELDDLNEVVNFYFEIERAGHSCPECDGEGANEDVRRLAQAWFRDPKGDFSGVPGEGWENHLTQDEVEALWHYNRLNEFEQVPDAATVNQMAVNQPLFHDGINRSICVQRRAERLGIEGECKHCAGEGVVFDEAQGHVELQLWVLHPRKGAARGVRVKRIEKHELPSVFAFLKQAQQRMNDKFDTLPE